jgi:hypothetical protein
MTFGVVMPLNPNPAPETVTLEIVKSAFPEFESVRLEEPAVVICTFPKFTALVLSEICGVLATAFAERFTTAGFPESPCTVSVPEIKPLAVGVTLTVNVPD